MIKHTLTLFAVSFALAIPAAQAQTQSPHPPIQRLEDLSAFQNEARALEDPWIKFVARIENSESPSPQVKDFYLIRGADVFHAEFVKGSIQKELSLQEINVKAQFNRGREFIFGNFFLGKSEWESETETNKYRQIRYQIVAREFPAVSHVVSLNRALEKFLGNVIVNRSSLEYLVMDKFQSELGAHAASLQAAGVSLAKSVGNASGDREVYNVGWASGTLKRLSAEEALSATTRGESFQGQILLIDGAPEDLPPAEGYILSVPSSVNGHPALLSRMLDVPLVYIKDSYKNPTLIEYETRKTALFVKAALAAEYSPDSAPRIYLGSLDSAGAKKLKSLKNRPSIGALKIDLKRSEVIESTDSKALNIEASAYGAKARGLVQISKAVSAGNTIPSLFIPLHYQRLFFQNAKIKYGSKEVSLDEYIQAQLGDGNYSTVDLAVRLKVIREAIQGATIDEKHLEPLLSGVENFGKKYGYQKLFFRSSSNAEDHELFNGAGLYDSKSALPERQASMKALRTVWGSLFNFKAYWARRQFKIDEATVGMGVVAQGFLQNIQSQGVAIASLKSFGTSGEVKGQFSTFPGLLQVTNPPPGKSPELVSTSLGLSSSDFTQTIERYCQNCSEDLRTTETVLSREDYKSLTIQIAKLLQSWPVELDIEYIKSNGQLYIVQARPLPKAQLSKETVLVGSAFLPFNRDRTHGDSNVPSILQIQGEIDLKLVLNTRSKLDDQLIEALEYTHQGVRKRLTRAQLKAKLFRRFENNILGVSLASEKYPSLALEVSMSDVPRNEDGTALPGIFAPSDLNVQLAFSGKTHFPISKRVSLKPYEAFSGEEIFTPFHVSLYSTRQRLSREIPEVAVINAESKEGGSIQGKLHYVRDTDPKHYGLQIQRFEISGVWGKALSFTRPAAFSYTAMDHHGSPELTVDLALADQKLDLSKLPIKGARYLWIFSEGKNPNRKVCRDEADCEEEYEFGFGGIAVISETGKWLGELTKSTQDGLSWR